MKRKLRTVFCVLLVLWLAEAAMDYARVSRFEKPLFCVPAQTFDDRGSSAYWGLGYRYQIAGNFKPETEYPDVTYYEMYVFGIPVKQATRD